MTKYSCPCCKYLTRSSLAFGTFEICPICYWEDDNIQAEDPNYRGGANKISLNEAQKNFLTFGAAKEKALKYVRKPSLDEMPNHC